MQKYIATLKVYLSVPLFQGNYSEVFEAKINAENKEDAIDVVSCLIFDLINGTGQDSINLIDGRTVFFKSEKIAMINLISIKKMEKNK